MGSNHLQMFQSRKNQQTAVQVATHLVYKELTHAEDIDQDATGKDRDPLSLGKW